MAFNFLPYDPRQPYILPQSLDDWLPEGCLARFIPDYALQMPEEKILSDRTAGLLNYADLARDSDLSAVTAKKYLRYLTLSYQAFLLPPYRSRIKERLIKAPRLYWTDIFKPSSSFPKNQWPDSA